MENDFYTADVIEVREKGTFKTEHFFRTPMEELGILSLKASRAEGEFIGNDGLKYSLKKTSFWKSTYEWRLGTQLIATAQKKGTLGRAFLINYENNLYGLFPGGSKLKSWLLKNAQEIIMSEFQPRGAFKRGAYIKIKTQIPLPLLVFVYCLVSRRWQEESS
jgi:hypothetical protein